MCVCVYVLGSANIALNLHTYSFVCAYMIWHAHVAGSSLCYLCGIIISVAYVLQKQIDARSPVRPQRQRLDISFVAAGFKAKAKNYKNNKNSNNNNVHNVATYEIAAAVACTAAVVWHLALCSLKCQWRWLPTRCCNTCMYVCTSVHANILRKSTHTNHLPSSQHIIQICGKHIC